MHELADRLAAGGVVNGVDGELELEFEARLRESSTLAFRVAYGVVRNREDAEDVAQEAFAKAYRAFNQLRNRERFRAWLVRMAWRLAIDRIRADRRRQAREFAQLDRSPTLSTEETVDARLRSVQLWRAIDALPEKLRIVVVLASIEGHNLGEVAALLRLPVGNAGLFERPLGAPAPAERVGDVRTARRSAAPRLVKRRQRTFEVLVAANELKGLHEMEVLALGGRVAVTFADEDTPRSSDSASVQEIVIAPIEIAPIEISANAEGESQ
jgi:RNA polymerase sigma factor (sigma-70 family)